MTTPLKVDPDDLRGYGSRTRARTADFKTSPPGADGDWPSQRSTRRMHEGVQATGQGFGDELDTSAGHADKSADSYQHQEAANTSAMKDVMGLMTSSAKDVGAIVTNVGQVGATMATKGLQGVVQAGTTGMTAAMTAAATAAKANPPGASGTPVGLQGGTGPITDSPTTDNHEGKQHERNHTNTAANT